MSNSWEGSRACWILLSAALLLVLAVEGRGQTTWKPVPIYHDSNATVRLDPSIRLVSFTLEPCDCAWLPLGRVHLLAPCEKHEKAIELIVEKARSLTRRVQREVKWSVPWQSGPSYLWVDESCCNCGVVPAGDGIIAALCSRHRNGVEEAIR